jgi:transposase
LLLRQCREMVVRLSKTENALIRSLQLEVGEVQRFSSIKKAVSYCGLCGEQKDSARSRR